MSLSPFYRTLWTPLKNWASSNDQVIDEKNHRQDQQQVNEAAGNMQRETQENSTSRTTKIVQSITLSFAP